jgi:hypothetical protein
VEQLQDSEPPTGRRKGAGRLGRGGTWGSISRVFARSRHRKMTSPSHEGKIAHTLLNPLLEKLRGKWLAYYLHTSLCLLSIVNFLFAHRWRMRPESLFTHGISAGISWLISILDGDRVCSLFFHLLACESL